jgi:hypothetical protein
MSRTGIISSYATASRKSAAAVVRTLAISGKPFLVGMDDTRGRFDQSLAIRMWGHGLFGFVKGTADQLP